MKGDSDETPERYQELHQAMVDVIGVGETLTLRQFAKYVMRCTGKGTRQTVHNYADSMDLLDLVRYNRKDHDKAITVLQPWKADVDPNEEQEGEEGEEVAVSPADPVPTAGFDGSAQGALLVPAVA